MMRSFLRADSVDSDQTERLRHAVVHTNLSHKDQQGFCSE